MAASLVFSASSIACLAAGLLCAVGLTPLTSVVPVDLAWSTSAVVVAVSIACFAVSAFALASAFAAVFSSSVKSVRESMDASLVFSASSIACLAAGLLCAVGLTEAMLVVPAVLACDTASSVVALSMFFLASSALALASALATAFSSSVKSVRESMAASLAFRASSIACLAAGLLCAVGLTEAMLVVPAVLACDTASSVVAVSMFFLASSALALASAFAIAFSSSVKSVRESMAASLTFRASSIACLATGLLCAVGLTPLTSVVPVDLAWSTSAFVVAASMFFLASSALALASAFAIAFSSSVKSVRESISASLALRACSIEVLASFFF
ncbi:hypothetical protein D8894_09320 [Streptococcus oralis]|nr:hypothetical protein D8894_09320 [Streptococcus oralis]